MNELILSLADKLDMTYDAVVNAYPEIANQIMYYNILGSFRPLLLFAIVFFVVSFISSILLTHSEPDGTTYLTVELEHEERKLNHAKAHESLYGEEGIKKIEDAIVAKKAEIKELKKVPKEKYGKYVKYTATALITTLLLKFGLEVLISVLAKDFIALSTILAGLN